MDFGEKSKVMEVLKTAFAGSVADKYVAAAAIREFEGILSIHSGVYIWIESCFAKYYAAYLLRYLLKFSFLKNTFLVETLSHS